jgi:hypothetical protein
MQRLEYDCEYGAGRMRILDPSTTNPARLFDETDTPLSSTAENDTSATSTADLSKHNWISGQPSTMHHRRAH